MRRTRPWPLWMVCCAAVSAAEFEADWQGSRRWTGPETWASPLYDWEVDDGVVVGTAASGRLLQRLTERVTDPAAGFVLRTRVELVAPDRISNPDRAWAGFAVGIGGLMGDPRHVAVMPKRRLDAGLRADGRLFVGGVVSDQALGGAGAADLVLECDGRLLRLRGGRGGRTVEVQSPVEPSEVAGNIALAADSPRRRDDRRGGIRARFSSWSGAGGGLASDRSLAFGPILWTQYTRHGGRVKLGVQMAPVGGDDDGSVLLEVRRDGEWKPMGSAPIDALSRTAVFGCDVGGGAVEYRVRYRWGGADHTWGGTFAADPGAGAPLKIAVFSCDHGYAFPQPKLVRNVAVQDPDLLFFAGDQIYEVYGGFGTTREPLETAMLDYLRKFYQFGWTWRELLRDRPSIIIPDDHDVFQGNLWGGGGNKTSRQEAGGYVMPAEWVNAVQRTQTAHLPDPVDPAPVGQGIGVYFTAMTLGGVPMAILEDRKFKSGPVTVLPKNRGGLEPAALDVAGAQLLGDRQERFLARWASETASAPLRLVLSQTIFCKAHTHTGPKLNRNHYDWDSNGWPQSGRRRALEPLKGSNTVMLHGDQHLGILLRQGVDGFADGPWAFMVPGTANGWPRAWWPDGGEVTGGFTDPFGNRFTVLAAANPEKGSNLLNPRGGDDPETTAQRKGSGHGLVLVPADRKSVRFEMWHYDFDAANPRSGDQFDGFPVTVELMQN